jgi:hypothetical protein
MKQILFIALFFTMIATISCTKPNPTDPTGPAKETPIVFITDANASNTSLANTFPVIVTLTSTMPSSSGINIAATVIDQTNNATIPQNQGINSTTAINNIQLINLPRQHWCTVTVKVTSIATPSNSATKTFNVVYK